MSGHSVGHLTVVVPAFAPSTVVAVETGTSPTVSPEPEIPKRQVDPEVF